MMPTFWQWWGIVGEIDCLLTISSFGFREEVRLKVRPTMTMAGYSDRQIFAAVCVVSAFGVVVWPVFILRSMFK